MPAKADTKRIALVEIGTNSTKLLIAGIGPKTQFQTLCFSVTINRIGARLTSEGRIDSKGVQRTLTAIKRFQATVNRYRCARVFVFATYALRRAANARVVVERIEAASGHRVKVLSGKEEAEFAYLSAEHALGLDKPATVLVDIGGGSTEVVLARGGRVTQSRSLALGALHLTERFVRSDPIAKQEFMRLTDHVARVAGKLFRTSELGRLEPSRFELVVSGGSIATLVKVIDQQVHGRGPHGQGTKTRRMRSKDVAVFLDRCLAMSLKDRKRIAGLEPGRADIIPAGLAVVVQFTRRLRKRVFRVNQGGVREGALVYLLRNDFLW
ncbi:MAG: hypothetical protein OEN01_03200 [Candidatus Krumholzibacteria bacterium]|nr:hypothetical protein [Candidatus Krumholzibacteria bacterium]